MRDTIATDGRARVMAGSTRWESEPAPPTGSQLSHSEKTTISTRPVQKIGIDRPNSDASRATASKTELGQTAETTPAATPTAAAIRSAAVASCSVAGHASASSAATGRFCWIERPRSPRARRPTYSRYRTANGLSRPRCSRSAATASLVACSPSISVTASPGSKSIVNMTTNTTPSRTGTASRRRRTTNVSIRRYRGAPRVSRGPPNAGGDRGAPRVSRGPPNAGGDRGAPRVSRGPPNAGGDGGPCRVSRGPPNAGGDRGAPRVSRGAPNAGRDRGAPRVPRGAPNAGGYGGPCRGPPS